MGKIKRIGGAIIIIIAFVLVIVLGSLPGILYQPHHWIEICICLLLFNVIFTACIWAIVLILSKYGKGK